MMTNLFSGVFTALATPMSQGAVDYVGLEALVQHQLAGGIQGLVSVGTTGESPTLSGTEHVDVIRQTVALAQGKVPVFAGTGSNCTREAIALTQQAEAAGADGFLIVAPYYNKPSQEGLYQHFSQIAATTEKPIILYSIPSRCGIEISVEVTARLYEAFPHIQCMKAAEGSCEKVSEYVRVLGPDFAVMGGDDGLILPFMSCGALGLISVASNLYVRPLVDMVAAANRGDYAHAQTVFQQYLPLFKALFIEPNPVPIKYALQKAGLIQSASVRLPLCALEASTQARLDAVLAQLPTPF